MKTYFTTIGGAAGSKHEGEKKDIYVESNLPCTKENFVMNLLIMIIGAGITMFGGIHMAKDSFDHAVRKTDEAEFEAYKELGIINVDD